MRPRRQVRHARINYPRKTEERTARHPLHRAHVRPGLIDRRVPLKHPVQQHPHTRHRHLFVPGRPPHRHQPRCRPVRRRRLQAAPSAPGRAPNAASASPSARSGGSPAHRTPRAERSYPYPPAKSPPPAPSSYTLQTAAPLAHSDCPPRAETAPPRSPAASPRNSPEQIHPGSVDSLRSSAANPRSEKWPSHYENCIRHNKPEPSPRQIADTPPETPAPPGKPCRKTETETAAAKAPAPSPATLENSGSARSETCRALSSLSTMHSPRHLHRPPHLPEPRPRIGVAVVNRHCVTPRHRQRPRPPRRTHHRNPNPSHVRVPISRQHHLLPVARRRR